jgi:integrase
MDLVIIRSYIISPARNAYADMKVAEEESDITKKHNYILLNEYGSPSEFIFNVFKNVKTLGQRRVKIDTETAKIIKLWLNHNTTGDFLVTLNDDPMTSQYLSHYLMSMFKKYINKPISSSMLRHIMISHDLRNTPTIKENEQKSVDIMNKYQHSQGMNQLYRKIR